MKSLNILIIADNFFVREQIKNRISVLDRENIEKKLGKPNINVSYIDGSADKYFDSISNPSFINKVAQEIERTDYLLIDMYFQVIKHFITPLIMIYIKQRKFLVYCFFKFRIFLYLLRFQYMRFFILTFMALNFTYLLAQEAPLEDNRCIDFNEFNACYSVEYRPRDEKVEKICSLKELMLNQAADLVGANAYLSVQGELLPVYSPVAAFDEQVFWKKVANILSHIQPEMDYFLVIELKIKLNGKIERYPVVSIKRCKEK